MATYYRREWGETRGDSHDDWGTSTWLFEVGQDGCPIRQVEIYADGKVLKYGPAHQDDDFGGLGDQPLDADEFRPYTVSKDVFQQAWMIEPTYNWRSGRDP